MRKVIFLFIILFFSTAVPEIYARSSDIYKRLSTDYETLNWVATVAKTEGPTVDKEGNVYFTETNSNRILKLSNEGELSTFRQQSNAVGMIFDMEGRLIVCESGYWSKEHKEYRSPPRVTRTDMKTGKVEVIAEIFGDKLINQPNDVTIDSKGRIYFTDMQRGIGRPPDNASKVAAVYRIDQDGTINRILTEPDILVPNGIIVSPDDSTLYLVESGPQIRLIRSYNLAPDGTVSNMRVFHNFGSGRSGDGLAIDIQGNLYVAAGLNRLRGFENFDINETLDTKAGIYIFSPSGDLIEVIPIPEDTVTNCAFGGLDMKTLYITAGKSLLTVRTKIAGTIR